MILSLESEEILEVKISLISGSEQTLRLHKVSYCMTLVKIKSVRIGSQKIIHCKIGVLEWGVR
jgi:hypothetical protein